MKEYTINSAKNKETKALDIMLEGHLNVANISSIKKDLTAKIKNNKNITINISNSDDADTTLIQLLMALKNKFKKKGVNIKINFNLNYEISELFARAGFSNTINN